MQRETKEKGDVNTSSLVDLKAELFRKQEEFKNQKLQNQNASYIKGKPSGDPNKKPNILSKKNAGVAKRAEKDYAEKKEEEDIFERSKKALESKARLYEKIAHGREVPDEDGSDLYLVDFQKKVIDDVMERREKERQEKEDREKREAEEEIRMLDEPVPEADNAEEEWVDYVDSLGRSRRCLRKDLPRLQEADRELKGARQDKSENTPGLLSDDMRREIERQKWEKEETEKMEKEKEGPIHYADVQHNEIRSHGVGFYQFDKEETVREEQLDQLRRLRDETKDERAKRERIKEKRKAALAARLAKVKQRKREKLGLPAEEEEDNASSDEMIGPNPAEAAEEQKEPEPLTRDDSWRKTADLTREWDRGKQKVTERSENAWLERQRAEREPDFAPPSFYYDDAAKSQPIKPTQAQLRQKPANSADATVSQESDSSYGDTERLGAEDKSSKILADVILHQLRKIRKDPDRVASASSDTVEGDSLNEQPAQYANVNLAGHSSFSHKAHGIFPDAMPNPSVFSVPPPNINIPPPNLHIPPPSLNVAVPKISIPPPSFNIAAPNLNVPPPNITEPNLNVPPPNISIPPQNIYIPPSNENSSQYSQLMNPMQPIQTGQDNQGHSISPATHQVHQAETYISTQQASGKPKRIISKMDIVDTRLMEREDD